MTTTSSPSTVASASGKIRLGEIDGIRGWAALFVLLNHMIVTPFGNLVPALNLPGFVFMNGILAVQIFFVLSGDALSAAFFFRQDPRGLDRLAVKRYFRLTMPILVSCLTIYGLMIAGLDFHQEMAALTRSQMLHLYLPQAPDFNDMLTYALVRVYTDYTFHTCESFLNSLPTAYNPVFWSMSVEMQGSLFVFLFLYLSPRLPNIRTALILLSLAFFLLLNTYAGFCFGLLLGYCRQQGQLDKWLASRAWQYISSLLLLAFIPASIVMMDDAAHSLVTLVAGLLIALLYTNRRALSFFRTPFSLFLGEMSFPLYAMHFTVLISFTSAAILWCNEQTGLTAPMIACIVMLSILASFAAAYALRLLERPFLRGLDYTVRALLPSTHPIS